MKKWFVLLMVLAAVGAGHVFAYQGGDHGKEAMQEKAMYQCPMHSEINQDKPGKCSECGMDLVKVDSKEEAKHSH